MLVEETEVDVVAVAVPVADLAFSDFAAQVWRADSSEALRTSDLDH